MAESVVNRHKWKKHATRQEKKIKIQTKVTTVDAFAGLLCDVLVTMAHRLVRPGLSAPDHGSTLTGSQESTVPGTNIEKTKGKKHQTQGEVRTGRRRDYGFASLLFRMSQDMSRHKQRTPYNVRADAQARRLAAAAGCHTMFSLRSFIKVAMDSCYPIYLSVCLSIYLYHYGMAGGVVAGITMAGTVLYVVSKGGRQRVQLALDR